MTKVKIFCGTDANLVEYAVNSFIHDKKVVDIKYQASHVTAEFTKDGVP